MIDELYQVLKKNIPIYKGKICIPVSGGLDSRVIAGFIAQNQDIDLAFTQFELPYPILIERNIENVEYARQISNVVGAKRFIAMNVNRDTQEDREAIKNLPSADILKRSKMYTGLRRLNKFIDTSDYTFILGHGLDSFTGIGVTPLSLLLGNPYKNDLITKKKKEAYFGGIFDGTYGKFGEWDCPLWNDEVEQFCLDLPLSDRLFQKLYRQMITKYFPQLATINRSDMRCPINVSESKYFYERSIFFLKKSRYKYGKIFKKSE